MHKTCPAMRRTYPCYTFNVSGDRKNVSWDTMNGTQDAFCVFSDTKNGAVGYDKRMTGSVQQRNSAEGDRHA